MSASISLGSSGGPSEITSSSSGVSSGPEGSIWRTTLRTIWKNEREGKRGLGEAVEEELEKGQVPECRGGGGVDAGCDPRCPSLWSRSGAASDTPGWVGSPHWAFSEGLEFAVGVGGFSAGLIDERV